MLVWVIVTALQSVADGFVHLGGDAHLLFSGWAHSMAGEEDDYAISGIDGFAYDVVLVWLVGATGA